jgi:hypothetical protein
MEAKIDEKQPVKKLSIKESHLQKLTATEVDRRTLAPYEAYIKHDMATR